MRKSNMKNLVMSVIALMMVAVLALGYTYSWAEGGNKGFIDSGDFVITTGSNLTMRQDGKTTPYITIPSCTLEETSSADGMNFFFPMGDNTKNTTTAMTFRDGTPADENTRYISVDFELEAGANPAEVWLGSGTIVQSSSPALMNAVRMSFYKNDGSDPIIFKPKQMPGISEGVTYSPITAISSSGAPTVTETSTEAFGNYYYNGKTGENSIFNLEAQETIKLTLAIWLEGTEFTGDDLINNDLSIYVEFVTQVDDLIKYRFADNTHSHGGATPEYWITNNLEHDSTHYATMMYIYDKDTNRYYAMEKTVGETYDSSGTRITGSEWEAYVPKDIKNFYFRRYSIDIDEWWNEWEPDMDNIEKDKNGEHTYVAICGNTHNNKINNDGCYGYWKDEYGTFRIYLEMHAPFSNLHCYAWNTSDEACASTGEWPGKSMTFVKNKSNVPLYCIDLKESENIAGIQFNNGGETRVYLDGFNYSTNTSAYISYTDGNNNEKYPLGVWPGAFASYDANNTVGKYYVDVPYDNVGQIDQKRDFNIIANNHNNGNQYPTSGDGPVGQLGGVYRFYNNSMTLVKLVDCSGYEITGDALKKHIFNGATYWCKVNAQGFYIYTDKEKSLIYPVNDPTP